MEGAASAQITATRINRVYFGITFLKTENRPPQ
jgi:hypothetical protein